MHKKDFELFAKSNGVSSTTMHKYGNVINGYINPSIIEERQMNIAQLDVFSRLIMDRIIFLGTGIDDAVANIIVAQLLYLDSADPGKDINLYIASPGGSVHSGLSIIDCMDMINSDVATLTTSMAASMGAVIASNGTKGKRSALRHARIMIHQPLGGAQGQASDMEITLKEMLKLKKELYEILSENSGQSYEKIEKDSDRDFWMTSYEAKEYGLIDSVIEKRK